MDCITKGLYLGDAKDAADLVNQNPERIAAILDCRLKLEQDYPIPPGIVYKRLGIEDGMAIPKASLGTALDFINDHLDRPMLVHCAAGQSRSPTMVAAFLVSSGQADDMTAALRRLRKIRATVNPDVKVWESAVAFLSSK